MTPGDPRSALSSPKGSGRRKFSNRIALGTIVAAFIVALIPLVAIVVYVFQQGLKVLDWDFLTEPIPISDRIAGPGMGPAVVGTLLITGAAALMAIPLGILGGIYVNEYGGRNPLARLIRFLAEVMTGVPSVVMGLFVYVFVILKTKEQNGFAGALALGALMLPIVLRTTDEMLKLVPRELREGSYALGARKARTIRGVVFPNAAPGIVSGALLAVAARRARQRRSCSRSASSPRPTRICSTAPIPRSPSRSSGTRRRRSRRHRIAPGAPRSRLVLIVFIFTVLARVVTAFFARRQGA